MCFQVLHLLQSQVCQGKDRVAWWCTEQKHTHRSPWALSPSSGDPAHRAPATGNCGFGLIPPWNRYSTSFRQRNWTNNHVVLCKGSFKVYLLLRTCYNSHFCFLQDLLPQLQAVCQCSEALFPPVLPVGVPAEVPAHGVEPKSEKSSEVEQVTGTKRKRTGEDASAPPAKKILGDGTRSPTTPVTWRSSTTGIVIKWVQHA